jgi:hypothetical protein
MSEIPIVAAPTITHLPPEAKGGVVVSGSHGGLYTGYCAAKAKVRAVIFNDAGIGRDEAGVASLAYLQGLGIAAATVSHLASRIGDAEDALRRGRISRRNALAAACGVAEGQPCREAAEALRAAAHANVTPDALGETRQVTPAPAGGRVLVLIDSASLTRPEDAGAIVVTGSHGGLVAGDPASALNVDAFAAVYNDAGIGIDEAGASRLPALDARGIAALVVANDSARIGYALSAYEDGVISRANRTATERGARVGMRLRAIVDRWAAGG